MKILLTGKDGQVGWELQRSLALLGEVIALGRSELNLEQPDNLRSVVRTQRPQIIVNAAAYTAVDRAETDALRAQAVNGDAPGILAVEAKKIGALLIHYSTDYVFDGGAAAAYVETDTPHPINIYGSTKLAGERAVQAAAGHSLILRTSWVYGMRGKNFLLTMRALMRERASLNVVDDQHGAPTWSRSIAEATALMLGRLADREQRERAFQQGTHIYHLSCAGATTWFGFAAAIAAYLRDNEHDAPIAALNPIATEQYPTPARRPRNSVLSNAKIQRDFAIVLGDWQPTLERCCAT
ncbi:MAG: dTDP-4-dehydrorhamnose reductase [Betaproteobacteria bacterium]